MKLLFKVIDCNCLACDNSIIKNWGRISTYECKFNIIQDLWYCYRFRDTKLKVLRNKIKIKRNFKRIK